MATVYDVKANELVKKTAEELKKTANVKMPAWAHFVKTGVGKDRAPLTNDWWYHRAAAVLRRVYLLGPIGVSKLRVKYGNRKNMGVAPERFKKAGGKIIRVVLQQLEKEGLIKQVEKSGHKGRMVAPKGKSMLDKAVKNSMKK
ncbi:MAG TPA: 30S ribosomal protein S19e [Nanoarchaeota archaeon]|nr:30S ribosomal protein S19e [Nanoarchaeota archaeon]